MAQETSVGIFSAVNVLEIINHKNKLDNDRPLNALFPDAPTDATEIEIRAGSRQPSRLQHTSIDGEARPVARGNWVVRKYAPSPIKAFDIISSADVAMFRRASELATIIAGGGTITGGSEAIMERARTRLREISEVLQMDISEERHALICGALHGSIGYHLDGLAQTVSYGLTPLDAPSPVWTNAGATIPKNIRTMKRVFSENSPSGSEPDSIVVPSDIIENAFDGNTEWKDFAKRTPELALEFIGRQVEGEGARPGPGPFGLKWYVVKGRNRSVSGDAQRRWPINQITLFNAAQARLSWGQVVGTEYCPRKGVNVKIDPPAKSDVATWKAYGFYNGLPVIGEPGEVQTCEVWTV